MVLVLDAANPEPSVGDAARSEREAEWVRIVSAWKTLWLRLCVGGSSIITVGVS